ncbi:MAG: hypothetical protein ACOC2J_02545 [bacterium]
MIGNNYCIKKKGNKFFLRKYNYRNLLIVSSTIFIFIFFQFVVRKGINSGGKVPGRLSFLDLFILIVILVIIFWLSRLVIIFLNKKKGFEFDLEKGSIKTYKNEYSFKDKYVCIEEKKSDDGSSYLLAIVSSDSSEKIEIMTSWNIRKINSLADDIATIIDSKVVKKEFNGPITVFMGW